jgi:hypothetical protein
LLDFNLQLSSPSTIAQLQKLELIRSRFETAGTVIGVSNMVDRSWVQKNVLRINDDEIDAIARGLELDKKQDLKIEAIQLDTDAPSSAPDSSGGGDMFGGGGDLFGGGEGNLEGGGESPADAPVEDAPELSEKSFLSINDEDAPIKVSNNMKRINALLSEKDEKTDLEKKIDDKARKRKAGYNRKELIGTDNIDIAGENKDDKKDDITGLPRLMADLKSDYSAKTSFKTNKSDLFEINRDEMNIAEYLDNKIVQNAKMTSRIKSTLDSLQDHMNSKPNVISENDLSRKNDDQT